jgi:hypothetical protein
MRQNRRIAAFVTARSKPAPAPDYGFDFATPAAQPLGVKGLRK